jgi:hypothetical protein
MVGQKRNVPFAFRQGGLMKGYDIETIKEVMAELTAFNQLF